MQRIYYSSLIILTVALTLTCCEQDKDKSETTLSSFDLIQTKIFNTSCAISGCHASEKDATFVQHNLILSEGASYANLIDKDPANTHAMHDGLKRVIPADSERSFLLHKLHCDQGHHEHDYGAPMPLGMNPLSKGQIDFITQWIKEGAPKDAAITADPILLEDNVPSCAEDFEPLTPPSITEGYQIKIEPFTIKPQFEREIFVYKDLGNDEDIYIKSFEMKMRRNSHHFLINTFEKTTPPQLIPGVDIVRELRDENGNYVTPTIAQMEYQIFTIASQTPELKYDFPPGVALKMSAHQMLDVNLHYVNKSNDPILGECYINLYKGNAAEVLHDALPIYFATEDIILPPNQKTIVIEDYRVNNPMKIFMLTSHTHKLGERFEIQIKGGPRSGEVIYSSSDWHHPVVKTFDVPVEINPGEGLTMIITYNNTTNKTVKFGLTSEDEMAIIFGYYY